MERFAYIFLIIIIPFTTRGQADSVKIIDEIIHQIDNTNLPQKSFDTNVVYNQVTDNGGEITVTYEHDKIIKIERQVGLSWGFSSTTFYFHNNRPIKIIEIEKNYRWNEEESEFDYTKLDEIFRWDYYIFNYDFDKGQIIRVGQPKFSEPACGLYEYEPTIELIKEYANKNAP